jgi:outer membrane lipoprotein-sorting protein
MRRWLAILAMAMAVGLGTARAQGVLEKVLGAYDRVDSMSCDVRRDMPLPDGQTLRMLSRVYFQRPDKLHVENFSPVKRRIVSDGTVFRSYTEGAAKGFSRPVTELDAEMLASLRMVPGSSANVLEPLRGAEETLLEPTAEYPVRAGYSNGKSFAVLNLDGQGRLARFEIYGSPAMADLRASTEFSAFQEVVPGTWIACLQQSKVTIEGLERTETTRVDNVSANGEIPAGLFESAAFFPGIEFVDSFDQIGM